MNRLRSSRHVRRAIGWSLAASIIFAARANAQDTVRAVVQGIRIDFQDADLRAVITALAEAGGLNVTYGDIPNRRVTLHLPQGLAKGEILALLRSIASSNGLRIVAEGTLLRVEVSDARELAGGLGRATGRENQQLFVYRLKHARAPRLASTLQSLFGGRAAEFQGNVGLTGRLLSDQLRSQLIPPVNPDTIGLPAVTTVLNAAVVPGAVRGEIQIVPDETTNSLLIRAQPSDYEIIRQAVDLLDLRPLQVFIEVLIAEVRRSASLDLGVTASGVKTTSDREISANITSASANDFIVRFARTGSVNYDVAIAALAARGDVRILSRPLILAENNLEARILVGSQRPFVQVFRSLPTDLAVRDQVVQYRDVGTSLSLLPTINPDGYVNLQVKQEVSSATAELQFGAPVISTREASTHLFVKDGETVVIGGLADRQVENNRSGIPFLSSIPFLGFLFGAQKANDAQNELYLFLTPHIVVTDEDAARLRRGVEGRLDQVDGQRSINPPVVWPNTITKPPVPPPSGKP